MQMDPLTSETVKKKLMLERFQEEVSHPLVHDRGESLVCEVAKAGTLPPPEPGLRLLQRGVQRRGP
jgi:hypothetical protein